MAARNKPYDQFGPYILFKKLEADALGELWRAGRIENGKLAATVALRKLTGGNRGALAANIQAIAPILPRISGSSFVRDQRAGVIDGTPWIAWEYSGGRSLRHVIDRGRAGKEGQPNPLPLDQAVVIAEKVALSLATMADLRDTNGTHFSHGALVPQFIWISDDGEIRVAGQQLGSGTIASLADAAVYGEIARYLAPEYRISPHGQKNADVYSMGAILFLLVTGQEPPDAATASAFVAAVRAGKTTAGEPIPDDIRVIIDKSFNLDPSMRYASIGEMKQAISGLASSGRYSASTFNLAFYLSTLLKKEMEVESKDRETEGAVDVAAYLEAPKAAPKVAVAAAAPAPAPVTPAPVNTPSMFTQPEPKKSRLPLAAAAIVVVAAAGAGAYFMLGKSDAQPVAKAPVQAQAIPVAPQAKPQIQLEPIAVSAEPATDTASPAVATTSDAEAAKKKAFEDAVRQKLQAEMMKLQDDFVADLQKKQAKNAPVPTDPAPSTTTTAARNETPTAAERQTMSAAQLDQQRLDSREPQATATSAPAAVQTQTAASTPAVVPAATAPVRPAVKEGDVIDLASLDSIPRRVNTVKPIYPPMAMRQKLTATIFLTVLVNEKGDVIDVRVLRGEERFGLNDAAVRAMRATRFSPPMKDGKRVRTWFPQTIEFRQ